MTAPRAREPAPYGAAYWNDVADGLRIPSLPAPLEKYACGQVEELIRSWAPPHAKRVLKTDLFEQAYRGPCWRFYEDLGDLVGIEVSSAIARRARGEAPGIGVVVGDVSASPFAAGSFDLIVSHSTLDHLSSDMVSTALAELRRLLRDDGILILTLDSRHNWLRHLIFKLKQRGILRDRAPYHTERFYSLDEATRVVEANQLNVAARQSVCAWFPLMNSYLRLTERLPAGLKRLMQRPPRWLLETHGGSPVPQGAATLIALRCTKSVGA